MSDYLYYLAHWELEAAISNYIDQSGSHILKNLGMDSSEEVTYTITSYGVAVKPKEIKHAN